MGSQRAAKLQRRAERAEVGISKQAEREQREFEALIARKRQELDAIEPIVSLAPKRQRLAWLGLSIVAVLLALSLGTLIGDVVWRVTR